MFRLSFEVLLSILLASVTAHPTACPPIEPGPFVVKQQDLYPEGADWDPIHCKLYLSSIYNCSLVAYDPYERTTEVIDIPGFTNYGIFNFTNYHLSGIDYDKYTGNVYLSMGAATSFTSTQSGDYSQANYTGPNHVVQYNTRTGTIVGDFDLKPAQDAYRRKQGHRTSGLQDTATDASGNTYALSSFGNSIAKIGKNGEVRLWYAPLNYSKKYGFAGLSMAGNNLIVGDTLTAGFFVFDTREDERKPKFVQPTGVPQNYTLLMGDGLYMPLKYGGKIALWSDDMSGTVVYASEDNWSSAQWVGLVRHPGGSAPEGGFATGTFEIGRIFSNYEFFQMELPQKPREDWIFYDITEQVENLVEDSGMQI